MLDIEYIRTHSDAVRRAIEQKQVTLDLDELLAVDAKRRQLIQQRDDLLAERNRLSIEAAKERGPAIKEALAALEPELKSLESQFSQLMLLVPQIPSPEAPVGGEAASVVLRTVGTPRHFDFAPKDHIELGTALDLLDLEAGVKVSGFRGYFLKNEAVLMHYGLMQLGLSLMRQRGFTLMVPPTIVRESALVGSGHFPFGRAEVYQIGNAARLEEENSKEQHFLVGTAEPSLLDYYQDTTLDAVSLPIRMCGISQCYRSEAGSYGKDTRGLYRIHEFMKVEQVVIAPADDVLQDQLFHEMLKIAEELLHMLELPYRILDIATGDMGAGKVRMHDIETWMPSRHGYGETHSNSALGDWQARRLGLRYKGENGKKRYAYTLNNTVIASPRILVALWENHQDADGTIVVPAPLRTYVGTDRITRE